MNKPLSLAQQAYEQIRHKIITLELPPGSVLDEAELQEEMGFGRTPIREAIKRLALENLVTIVPRRGMFVADIGVNDLQRLLEVRLVLETLAVRLAAQRGTPEHWRRLHALLDQSVPTVAEDPVALIEADEAFHEVIYDAADNEYLQDMLAVLLRLNERLWYHFLPGTNGLGLTTADHRAIAASLEAGDAVRAEALMVEHIRRVQTRARQRLIDAFPK
jgi:DNA-binding GntR family transcriptional regulator